MRREDKQPIDTPEFQSLLQKVMNAIGELAGENPGQPIDGRNITHVLNFVVAVMLESVPDTATNKALREACEAQAQVIHYYAKNARAAFDASGEHPWNALLSPRSTTH